MIKNFLVFIVFLFISTSCSSIKETFVDVQTGQKIAGYDKECPLRIGKTAKKDVSYAQIEMYESNGLYLMFLPNTESGHQDSLLLGVSTGSSRYQTLKGIKVGGDLDKAAHLYGIPKFKIIGQEAGKNDSVEIAIFGLFYNGLTFVSKGKGSNEIIYIGIHEGNQKQYTRIRPF